MHITVSTEVKNNEFRVAITPVGVHELIRGGHEVCIQAGAGISSSIPDEEFVARGAKIVSNAADTWEVNEIVIKVKGLIPSEYRCLREDLVLLTYLCLATSRPQADAPLRAGITAIAYETVQLPSGALPLLYPMSEITGSLTPQVDVHALMRTQGRRGVLMDCIGGVPSAKAVVLGGGVAGQNVANIAMGFGVDITVLDTDLGRLRNTFWRFYNQAHGVVSSALTVQGRVPQADLMVGTVLIPGAKAPKLVTNDMVARMKSGSVLVDVVIDQGGYSGGSHPATHDDPTFPVRNSQFYCVANMPGAVLNTPIQALTNAAFPCAAQLADKDVAQAPKDNPALAEGLNMARGNLTFAGASETFNLPLIPLTEALDHVG